MVICVFPRKNNVADKNISQVKIVSDKNVSQVKIVSDKNGSYEKLISIVIIFVSIVVLVFICYLCNSMITKKQNCQIANARKKKYNETYQLSYNKGYKDEKIAGNYEEILKTQADDYEMKISAQRKVYEGKIASQKKKYENLLLTQKNNYEQKIISARETGLTEGKKSELSATGKAIEKKAEDSAKENKWDTQLFTVK